jgi:hypothetical protein
MSWFEGTVLVHALAGGAALLSMVVPIVSAKGGQIHRLSGRFYAASMAVVVSLAWVVIAARVAGGDAEGPLFLGLVGALAGASVWSGWRVRSERGRTGPHTNPLDRGVQTSLAAVGAAGVAWGAWTTNPLFLAFGGLCAWRGASELRAMAAPPTDGRAWLRRHLAGMLAGCIATTTAFLVVNVARFPPALRGALPGWAWWLLPTAVGVPLIVGWSRRYSPPPAS